MNASNGEPLRVVMLCQSFARNMGYIENCLPRHLARQGADVHLFVTPLGVYSQMPDYKETYLELLKGDDLRAGDIESIDGFTLHVLPHRLQLGYVRMQGLQAELAKIRPHVVQAPGAIGWIPLDAAVGAYSLGYKLFTANHTTRSMLPLTGPNFHWLSGAGIRCALQRTLPGRITSLVTEKCYCPTWDSAEMAWKRFGVQRQKVEVMHLGVETDRFHPPGVDERARAMALRMELGFSPEDIVVVYTGKFTADKNPLILAESVDEMRRQGVPIVALFVGDGIQREALIKTKGTRVVPFVPNADLPQYYWAADVAVWPTTESTSMLDAAACGLPLVISSRVAYREHVDGNGFVFEVGNRTDLMKTLTALLNPTTRATLGRAGAEKMRTQFSWEGVARRRLFDYREAVYGRSSA